VYVPGVLAEGVTVPVELLIIRPDVELKVPPVVPVKVTLAVGRDRQYGDPV
jgi:hypothetical protein